MRISTRCEQALFCYWVTNGLFSLFQTILFRWGPTKRLLGIPTVILSQKQQIEATMKPSGIEKFIGKVLPSFGKSLANQRISGVKSYTQRELSAQQRQEERKE